jgi:hypothetical protein
MSSTAKKLVPPALKTLAEMVMLATLEACNWLVTNPETFVPLMKNSASSSAWSCKVAPVGVHPTAWA